MYRKRWTWMIAAVTVLGLAGNLVCVQAEDVTEPLCPQASAPSPKDGATDALRDGTTLSWTPGGTTGKYDVYLGTVRKYVENAERVNPVYVEACSIGQTGKTFKPGRLELGQTYYWRVDEVDESDPNNIVVCKGDVWSFMVEVPALPVARVTATASSSADPAQGPENLVNGAGLSPAGTHSADPNTMWLSAAPVVAVPEEPNVPAEPNAPTEPNVPAEPNMPAEPSVPAEPNAPAEPPVPAAPVDMTTPSEPSAPVVPADANVPQTPDNTMLQIASSDANAPAVEPNVPAEVPATWVQFQFDKIQTLYDMSIWNWNAADSLDLGVKSVTVLYSMDGTKWMTLGDFDLAQGTGSDDYVCNDIIPFGGVVAMQVKLVINSGFGSSGIYGLSAVEFSALPVYAREASPASGTKNIALDGTLSWRAGREAAAHKVYLSTDKTAVQKGTAKSFTVSTNSFKLSAADLELEKTYYWRIDEVNDAMDPKSFAGDVWSFTVVEYLVVDNFEQYKYNMSDPWTPARDSSWAGMNRRVVHGGRQSLEIRFNTLSANFDVGVTGAVGSPTNWTKNGIKKLVLFVHGDPENSDEPMVLTVNDAKAGSFSPTKNPWWGCWIIDLASVKSTLGKVQSITIGHDPWFGVRHRGGEKLYIDDIRLYNTKVPSLDDMVTEIVGMNGKGATKGQFDTLLAAVTAADPSLLDLLSSDATYTLFAPTNSAFAAAGISDQTDEVILNDVLRNHIVARKVSATNQGSLKTLEGSTLVQDAALVTDDIGDQAVITASTDVLNGTLHTVDTVLLPYHLAKIVDLVKAMNGVGDYKGQFDTLLAAIGAAKATVRDTLGKRLYTLFAPTDAAFAALGYDPASIKKVDPSLLSDILLYHIASGRLMSSDLGASIKTVEGGTLKYSKGKLTDAVGGQATLTGLDVEASNGTIHIIDAVVMPFAQTRLLDVVAAIAALNRQGSLAGQFDTLVAAAEAADPAVLGALAGKGPYTLFAPRDDAFAALGLDPNNVGDLDPVYLGDVLLYHAVAGRLSAKDVAAAQEIKTVQGGVIARDPNDPNHPLHGAYAGAARITTPDIEAFNGLIQVVDAVLLPYEEPVPPPPPAPEPEWMSLLDTVATLKAHGGQFDTFLAAVAMADEAVLDALSGPAENTLFLPTDDAFAALEPAIGSLPQIVVTDILLYHLTPGRLTAADVWAAESIPMLKGGALQQANGVLTDNTGRQAKIVVEDIEASNGVIHVIDVVLLPAEL